MNYAARILNYLASQDGFSQVLLVGGAPPTDKRSNGIHIVINAILTPDDIRDTLNTFATHVRGTSAPDLGRQGVFSFGMPNLGRFRVNYLTQRGSDVVAIQRMPFAVPELESLVPDPSIIEELDKIVSDGAGGIVLVVGPSPLGNVQLVYSLLKRINDTASRVIYILERNLSFLLAHKNSVAIQVEIGTDIPTLAEGMRNGLFLSPDIMYVRDCKTRDEIAGVVSATQAGSLVFVSAVAFSEKFVMQDFQVRLEEDYDTFCRQLKKVIRVASDSADRLSLQVITPSLQ